MAELPTGGEPKRLLIVDDEPHLLRLLMRALQRYGYHATLCTSVEAAGQALSDGRYAGALVDLYFGAHPSGLDLVARIRSQPATANMPVVSMSGSGSEELGRCLKAGADTLLSKPFVISEVIEALSRATALRGGAGGPSAPDGRG